MFLTHWVQSCEHVATASVYKDIRPSLVASASLIHRFQYQHFLSSYSTLSSKMKFGIFSLLLASIANVVSAAPTQNPDLTKRYIMDSYTCTGEQQRIIRTTLRDCSRYASTAASVALNHPSTVQRYFGYVKQLLSSQLRGPSLTLSSL